MNLCEEIYIIHLLNISEIKFCLSISSIRNSTTQPWKKCWYLDSAGNFTTSSRLLTNLILSSSASAVWGGVPCNIAKVYRMGEVVILHPSAQIKTGDRVNPR
jgi:hypothetical protein